MTKDQEKELRRHCIGRIADMATQSGVFLTVEELIFESQQLFEYIETGGITITEIKMQAQA